MSKRYTLVLHYNSSVLIWNIDIEMVFTMFFTDFAPFFQRMEEMLNGFQGDLSSISSEIQTLQEQSVSMNIKLKNRQVRIVYHWLVMGNISAYLYVYIDSCMCKYVHWRFIMAELSIQQNSFINNKFQGTIENTLI